jgi:hypothetical protein
MTKRVPPPGELEQAFARAHAMQAELARRERTVGRRIQTLARGLAGLTEPGDFFHRIGVGLHAYQVDGEVCLAASYLEEAGDEYRYRYAVLCGGEPARRALRDADLERSASDEPGPGRQIAIANYADYDDFLYRLPKYLGDVNRRLEQRLRKTDESEAPMRDARREIRATSRRASSARRLEAGDEG